MRTLLTFPEVTRTRTWSGPLTPIGSLANCAPMRCCALRASALFGSAPPSGTATESRTFHFPVSDFVSSLKVADASPDHWTPTVLVWSGTVGAFDWSPASVTPTGVFWKLVGGAEGPAPAASAGTRAPRPATNRTNKMRRMGSHLRGWVGLRFGRRGRRGDRKCPKSPDRKRQIAKFQDRGISRPAPGQPVRHPSRALVPAPRLMP